MGNLEQLASAIENYLASEENDLELLWQIYESLKVCKKDFEFANPESFALLISYVDFMDKILRDQPDELQLKNIISDLQKSIKSYFIDGSTLEMSMFPDHFGKGDYQIKEVEELDIPDCVDPSELEKLQKADCEPDTARDGNQVIDEVESNIKEEEQSVKDRSNDEICLETEANEENSLLEAELPDTPEDLNVEAENEEIEEQSGFVLETSNDTIPEPYIELDLESEALVDESADDRIEETIEIEIKEHQALDDGQEKQNMKVLIESFKERFKAEDKDELAKIMSDLIEAASAEGHEDMVVVSKKLKTLILELPLSCLNDEINDVFGWMDSYVNHQKTGESYLSSDSLLIILDIIHESTDLSVHEPEISTVPQSEAIDDIDIDLSDIDLNELGGMDLEGGDVFQDLEMIKDFINETTDHLEEADKDFLELENNPDNKEAIDGIFRAFHTTKGISGFLGLGDIQSLTHETENLLDLLRKPEYKVNSAVFDTCFVATAMLKTLVAELEDCVEKNKPLEKNPGLASVLEQVKATTKAVKNKDTSVLDKQVNIASSPIVNKSVKKKNDALRVKAERLDLLIDTIGELVIAESMLADLPEIKGSRSALMMNRITQVTKITKKLQHIGMSMRMLSLKGTFNKMSRLIRDVSKKLDKKIELVIIGEDIELDKTVVDNISDPLVHMLRNAADHGLESNSERLSIGKDPVGRIELSAIQKGSSVYIEIEDDGKGLNRDAILKKAISNGVIQESNIPNMSDSEINGLIFANGFSTTESVTDLSGRGVGMDVVKRNIEELRGQVEIETRKGEGTMFRIKLPLSLAIIDGMLLEVANEIYIIPTLSIIRTVQIKNYEKLNYCEHERLIKIDGEVLPFLSLESAFGVMSVDDYDKESLGIIVEGDNNKVVLLADKLLGKQQVVIKSLGDELINSPGIAGGAILANGQVGLIIDITNLIKSYSTAPNLEPELQVV